MSARVAMCAVLLALCAPFAAYAHEPENALSAEIRADLMQDPRTATLSHEELDAMVATLAQEMEAQGAAAEYLESQHSFDPAPLFSPPEAPPAWVRMIFSPLGLAVALFFALLVAVAFLIMYRHNRRPAEPDLTL